MDPINDGCISWVGGMDSSRSPIDIADTQYSRACNVIIPRSLGGIKVRHGIHYQDIHFKTDRAKDLYEKGHVQAEGFFTVNDSYFLVVVVDGYTMRFSPINEAAFEAEIVNINDPNESTAYHWVIRVPDGCIINNGKDLPLFVGPKKARRSNPQEGEIGVGRMGVYIQNRLFYCNENSDVVLASDYLNPLGAEEQRITGIIGFACPDNSDSITAVGKQKVMLEYATGGALIFSTRTSLYSVDVRGDRNSWADLGSRVGKVTQTVEGLNACSSYSFESFGTNIYFRNFQFGIADLKQSQYQFNNIDGIVSESIEASHWLDRDTDWMLSKCYTRSCNSRLFTTIAPQQDDQQRTYWSGILSYHPSAIYSNQSKAPRRYESIFTGVRPWCMTSVKVPSEEDKLFIHSFDQDGINRLYKMVKDSDYDINHEGRRVEIEGWIETRGFDYDQRFSLKTEDKRFYSLREFSRNITICVLARNETSSGWVPYHSMVHKIPKPFTKGENGEVIPRVSRPQTRYQVNMPEPRYSENGCGSRTFIWSQDRIEFKGPIHLDHIIRSAKPVSLSTNISKEESEHRLVYDIKPDFSYSIQLGT